MITICNNIKHNKLCMEHHLGFKLPNAPYLWDYNDMEHPYDTLLLIKSAKVSMKNLNRLPAFVELSDDDTDFFIHVQKIKNDDTYLSYHTWLLNKEMEKINHNTNRLYLFRTALYVLDGVLEHSKGYPDKGTYQKNKPGGIPINSAPKNRVASVHKNNGAVVFSSVDVCNFKIKTPQAAFISLLTNASDMRTKEDLAGKKNCVVLHICMENTDYYKEYVSRFI